MSYFEDSRAEEKRQVDSSNGLPIPRFTFRQLSASSSLTPLLSQLQSAVSGEEAKSSARQSSVGLDEELVKLEQRLERRMETCFAQLQQHIDNRFDLLEERLGRLHDRLEKSSTNP